MAVISEPVPLGDKRQPHGKNKCHPTRVKGREATQKIAWRTCHRRKCPSSILSKRNKISQIDFGERCCQTPQSVGGKVVLRLVREATTNRPNPASKCIDPPG